MSGTRPFTPNSPTVTLSNVGTTSVGAAVDANADQIRVLNVGPALVFFRFGTGAQTATASDYPLAVGMSEVFSKGIGADNVAVLGAAAGPSVVYVTPGTGI